MYPRTALRQRVLRGEAPSAGEGARAAPLTGVGLSCRAPGAQYFTLQGPSEATETPFMCAAHALL